MRLLAVHPGASYATADVFDGLVDALRNRGVEIQVYDLESRLELATHWTRYVWRKAGKPEPRPTPADTVYHASKDVLERAFRWEVDGVLIVSAMFLHPDLLVLLRRAGLRTALLLTESPYDDVKQARVLPLVDLAWTNERASVARLRQVLPSVGYLPHAYNPAIHHSSTWRDDPLAPTPDVVMVGSLFSERVELLGAVDWTGINLALYGEWRGLPSRHPLRRYVKGEIVANQLAAVLYRHAKIGLNLYRESVGFGPRAERVQGAESLNPRALELAACQCFQISQPRAEVLETFGDAVPTFATAAELGQLVRYYLAHPLERADKARRAAAAIRGHTFAAMAATILTDLDRHGWPVHRETLQWPSITDARAGSTPRPTAAATPSLLPA